MSINNGFYIPFTSLWGNTFFCSDSDNFFDRQEYSLTPQGTNLNCLLGRLKHRWVPQSSGSVKPENPYQNLDNKHHSLTPTGNQPGRWRNYYVCKKFYPEVQSQDDSTKKCVNPTDNTFQNQKSDTADKSRRAAQQTSAAERPGPPWGICKRNNT